MRTRRRFYWFFGKVASPGVAFIGFGIATLRVSEFGEMLAWRWNWE